MDFLIDALKEGLNYLEALLDSFMDRVVKNEGADTRKYRRILFNNIATHFVLMLCFLVMRRWIFAILNLVSLVVFVMDANNIHCKRTSIGTILMLYCNIMIHSSLYNLFMGWEYGFFMYGLVLIPVIIYLCSQVVQTNRVIVMTFLMVVGDIVLMALTAYVSLKICGYGGNNEQTVAMDLINFMLCSISLISYSRQFLQDIRGARVDLVHQAKYDTLTGLRNRNELAGDVKLINASRVNYCVVLGDIDDFKKINDNYGHNFGDVVLENIGNIFRTSVDKDDLACRWGGEEFVVVLLARIDQAMAAVERIQKQIRRLKLECNGKVVPVHMTFGVAKKGEAELFDDLVAIADRRMYRGKRNGKDQIVYSDETHSVKDERLVDKSTAADEGSRDFSAAGKDRDGGNEKEE